MSHQPNNRKHPLNPHLNQQNPLSSPTKERGPLNHSNVNKLLTKTSNIADLPKQQSCYALVHA